MTDERKMRLGVSVRGLGYHISAWRHPGVDPAASEKLSHFVAIAQLAEAAKLDFLFLADSLVVRSAEDEETACRSHSIVEFDPLTLLPALAAVTRHVGLVATASTSYNEPYHLARKFASLDHLSEGRAAWNAVTSYSEAEALNFSRSAHYSREERYARAEEFLECVAALWNSWDAGAFIRDVASGRFYDPAGKHVPDYRGRFFQVRGPLSNSRTPQGRPLIVQAGASDRGVDLAGRFADMVYSLPVTRDEAAAGRAALRARAAGFGRSPDDIKSMPGCQIILGCTHAEAEEKRRYLFDLIDPLLSLQRIRLQTGLALTEEDLDRPVPADGGDGSFSVTEGNLRVARERGWTVRQLCQAVGMGQQFILCGTADEVADGMAGWFAAGACDGFNLLPTHTPANLAEIAEGVIPRLQDRGLFRRDYEGATLRENLGLRPV